jgi:predicted metal-dependent phosphoesterase TrpH
MKVLFHVHTNTSSCASLTENELISYAVSRKIDVIFLTNHNKLTIPKTDKVKFIPSEEIRTKEGDVIGIFLKERIPADLGMAEAIAEIHRQGGLAVAPHSTDPIRREAMSKASLIENINNFDIIETSNARSFNFSDKVAKKVAGEYHKAEIKGGDVHFKSELGNTVLEMAEFAGPKDFLTNLEEARTVFRRNPFRGHLNTFIKKYLKLRK